MSRPAFGPKLALARAAGSLSRRTGRGGGTTLPGRMLLRMEPEALELLGRRLSEGAAVISATNGKTTTAGMLASILRSAGREPVHNRAGSNMHWGVATALVEQRGSEGLFEVDEAWMPQVVRALDARLVVLGNLFRDQLDRYGELETIADAWAELVAERATSTAFVLCADDPSVAELGLSAAGKPLEGMTTFGIEDRSVAMDGLQHAHDAKTSRRTGEPFTYETAFVGHLGIYRLRADGPVRRKPDVAAVAVRLRGMDGSDVRIETPEGDLELALPVPGLYNVYNALGAVAAALRMGVGLHEVKAGMEGMSAVFGRVERIPVGDRELAILLIKNPAGANEVLRTVRLDRPPEGLDLWIALNDGIADGRDVSWIWDADFELLAGAVRRVTCVGTRGADMALRLKYAGLPPDSIVLESDLAGSLDGALARSGGRLFALPTYTALLELRTLLSGRGLAPDYWS